MSLANWNYLFLHHMGKKKKKETAKTQKACLMIRFPKARGSGTDIPGGQPGTLQSAAGATGAHTVLGNRSSQEWYFLKVPSYSQQNREKTELKKKTKQSVNKF